MDALTLNALCFELDNSLRGGKIEKIYQPEVDEVTFSIKSGGTHTLIISCNPLHSRAHLTTAKKENSATPPAFCMLLRKYLAGAIIKNVSLLNGDRVIMFTVSSRNEMKDTAEYYLIAELMGRYSNIILCKDNFIIIDALKRVPIENNPARFILPSAVYKPVTQLKIPFCDADSSVALSEIGGLSKESLAEIEKNGGFFRLEILRNIYGTEQFKPCIRVAGGKAVDFYANPYGMGEYSYFPTLSGAMDAYFSVLDKADMQKEHAKRATAVLKRLIAKNLRRIDEANERIALAKTAESFKSTGDLILANIYKIKPRDTALVCTDFYTDETREIPIDPYLSPAQNAQIYYKKYGKLKRGGENAEKQLENFLLREEYLKTVSASLDLCETKQEFEEILRELNAFSGAKPRTDGGKKRAKIKAPQYYHKNINGFDIYWGKNNAQNDAVTFTVARPSDTWLHVKSSHGSHVVIKGIPDDTTLLEAAKIAATFSQAKNSDKVEVDYCLKKYVKKTPDGLSGMVNYTNYKTIVVKRAVESGELRVTSL